MSLCLEGSEPSSCVLTKRLREGLITFSRSQLGAARFFRWKNMDSRIDTYQHIQTVQRFMDRIISNLMYRQREHDQSKLVSPEKEVFDEYTPKLATSTYGSDEYKSFLAAMKPALDHHYSVNSHHPEYYENGIKGMSLLDLVEMLCDWKAATMRHNDGCIRRSIEINQQRFGYSDELKQIFLNTLDEIEGKP